MQVAVVLVVPAALIWAANTAMLGLSRHVYVLATNRQIPSWLGKLNRRFRTPHVAIVGAAVIAIGLIIPADVALLGGLFAFGATIAFTIAHVSVIRMRITEPDRDRARSASRSTSRMFGARIPLPTLLAAVLTALAWLSVVIYHDTARWVGGGWMLFGLVGYVIYRKGFEHTPLTERVEVPAEALVKTTIEAESGDILVPVFGTKLDDDIVGTAGRLADAAETPGELQPRMEVDLRRRVPLTVPLDSPPPPSVPRRPTRRSSGRRRWGRSTRRSRCCCPSCRARSVGAGIVEAARDAAGRDDRDGRRAPDADPRRSGLRRHRWLAARRDRTGDRVRACAEPPAGSLVTAPVTDGSERARAGAGPLAADDDAGRPRALPVAELRRLRSAPCSWSSSGRAGSDPP